MHILYWYPCCEFPSFKGCDSYPSQSFPPLLHITRSRPSAANSSLFAVVVARPRRLPAWHDRIPARKNSSGWTQAVIRGVASTNCGGRASVRTATSGLGHAVMGHECAKAPINPHYRPFLAARINITDSKYHETSVEN